MRRLPRIIDLSDDLRRAAETSDNDVDDDVSDVLSTLERFADPDRRDQIGLLDDAENTLLRLQEQETDDTATQRFQAARNRIEIFRNAVGNATTDLVVVDSEVVDADEVVSAGIEPVQGTAVDVRVSVVNLGEAADGVVAVAFYDEEGSGLGEETATASLDADAEETVTLSVVIPDEAAYYASVAREAPA